MPPGVPPILLFRTFVRNLPMAKAMGTWGTYELSKRLSLSMRDREIIIDRTCARCGCEYEWGVHIAYFAGRVGLTSEQVTSLTHGSPATECWSTGRDRVLIEVADSLHDTAQIDDELWGRLSAELTEAEIDAVRLVSRHQLRGERGASGSRGRCPAVCRRAVIADGPLPSAAARR